MQNEYFTRLLIELSVCGDYKEFHGSPHRQHTLTGIFLRRQYSIKYIIHLLAIDRGQIYRTTQIKYQPFIDSMI